MDEQFRNGNGGNGEDSPFGGKDFSEYYEQRSKRIKNFTLNMGEPEGYTPKYGAAPAKSGSDVYSYGEDGADRKREDYIELTRNLADGSGESEDKEQDYDELYFGENGIYTRSNPGKKAQPAEEPQEKKHKKPVPAENDGQSKKKKAPEGRTERAGATQVKTGGRPSSEPVKAQKANADGGMPSKRKAQGERPSAQQRPAGSQKPAGSQRPSGGTPQQGGKSAQGGKTGSKKKKMRGYTFVITVLGFLCSLVFIAAVTAGVSTFVLSAVDDILSINPDKTVVTVTIPENAEYDQIIDILSDSGIINQRFVCKFFAKFRHFDGYTSSETNEFVKTEYAPGIYYIQKDDGLEAILNSMKVGYGSFAETVTVSFPEGWTISQIFEKLEKKDVCEAAILYANLDMTAQQYNFYEKIPDSATRYQKLEGYLFPDTYEFYVGENPNSVLSKLFDNFQKKMTSSYRKRAKELGLTTDQVLTIASILQREGTNKDQMKTISSIIHNRLNHASAFPLLQCDSTSTYASNYIVPNVDSYYGQLYSEAYNTYSANGLPPGPICNPGDDAINAALYPEETNYYYFCHDSEGNMYVAENYEEHRVNIARALG